MTSARRRLGASATPATSSRIAVIGRTHRSRSSMRKAVCACARLVLSRRRNWAFTVGMRSAKGTPRSTSTGLMASMNAARFTVTLPSLTVTPLVVSPVSAATRLSCALRFAATHASWNASEATSLETCSSVKP